MGVAWRKVCRACDSQSAAVWGRGLVSVRAARDAAFDPVDHVAGVGFEQEFELGCAGGDAFAQAGRFVDVGEPIHLGFDAGVSVVRTAM